MTGLQRHKPMKRSKLLVRTALSRGKPLTRKGRVKPRNSKRKAAAFARNFGDEADAVRAMPCRLSAMSPPLGLGWSAPGCCGDIVVAHVVSRGASGGRFDIIPLCQRHHDEQHACGIETFSRRYGLDLRREADRVALEHAAPLGLRMVARRWTLEAMAAERFAGAAVLEVLDAYERAALLGWVGRRMGQVPCNFAATTSNGFDVVARSMPPDRETIAHAVMLDLGELFTSDPSGEHGLAWSLCEQAGWPS